MVWVVAFLGMFGIIFVISLIVRHNNNKALKDARLRGYRDALVEKKQLSAYTDTPNIEEMNWKTTNYAPERKRISKRTGRREE